MNLLSTQHLPHNQKEANIHDTYQVIIIQNTPSILSSKSMIINQHTQTSLLIFNVCLLENTILHRLRPHTRNDTRRVFFVALARTCQIWASMSTEKVMTTIYMTFSDE